MNCCPRPFKPSNKTLVILRRLLCNEDKKVNRIMNPGNKDRKFYDKEVIKSYRELAVSASLSRSRTLREAIYAVINGV